MKNSSLTPDLLRVCDANLNRLREGVRVIEDILRYKENDKHNASLLKRIRHNTKVLDYKDLLQYRDSINDVLKTSTSNEQKRTSLEDIIISNFKRAEESSRVLEEIFKLESIDLSEKFKSIRYELYTIEKSVLTNL